MADEDVQSIVLSYKYRLLPTRAQHRALERILEDQRQLYNAALQERIDCYAKTGRSIAFYDQCKSSTQWRSEDTYAASFPANLHRWTLRRLDDAFKGFYGRIKSKSARAGYPKFRSANAWKTFGFNCFHGIRFVGNRIRFRGLPGRLRVNVHREMPPSSKVLSCTFTTDAKGWVVCFQVRHEVPALCTQPSEYIGIDVGIKSLAVLSDGTSVENIRASQRSKKEMRRRSRALHRSKIGSKRRRRAKAKLAKLHGRVANQRNTHLHRVSSNIVSKFDIIAVERLNVRGLARTMLAKHVHDAAWRRFLNYIMYKAKKSGTLVIGVDPRNTSLSCSGCGAIVEKKLSDRIHECGDCGLVMDRDHNAAINILHKAVAGLGVHNVAGCSERAHGNIIGGHSSSDEKLPPLVFEQSFAHSREEGFMNEGTHDELAKSGARCRQTTESFMG